ncbi:MAG: ATP-dependent DNA helicase, partial [Planctomycetaceae bacterium]|nr:ATP-dependent DNA helicase [Planctomycetaceae bacterium]
MLTTNVGATPAPGAGVAVSVGISAPPAAVRDVLGPGGAIARHLDGYEARPQQLAMAEAVAEAIASRSHLVVEAGTGTGKSLAYLVPAILAAVASGKKVVVATQTIALQEQIITKDLPLLHDAMPMAFRAVLLKGRGNYVSLRRLAAAVGHGATLFRGGSEEAGQLARLAQWSGDTSDGSTSDLAFRPLPFVWDEVRSDLDNCLGQQCPRHSECFYYATKRRVESAHVVIVNHALYMTDVALRRLGASFLPEHDVAIFDEAHTLEAVASEHLGTKVGQGQVEYFLRKLDDERTDRGLIARCREALGDEWFKAADAQAGRAWAASYDFFAAVAALMSGDPGRGIGPKTTLRFHEPPGWPAPLAEELRKLATALGRGVATLEARAGVRTLSNGKKLATLDEHPGVRDLRLDLDAARDRAAAFASGIDSWINQDVPDGVYWVEFDPAKRRVTLASAPLEVGPTLRAELFDRVPTCILTSATLAIGAPPRFDHVTGRLGLDAGRTLAVGSPFDYAQRVELHLNRSLPCPSKKSADYERAAIRAIPYYVDKTHGKAFVLFTSHAMLEAAARELRPWFDRRHITLITQGDGMPRTKMIETFRAIHEGGGAATLFGVDSFWEGVDVPGAA